VQLVVTRLDLDLGQPVVVGEGGLALGVLEPEYFLVLSERNNRVHSRS